MPCALNLDDTRLGEHLIDHPVVADADAIGVLGAREPVAEPCGNGSWASPSTAATIRATS
jgi:hypothetical protein